VYFFGLCSIKANHEIQQQSNVEFLFAQHLYSSPAAVFVASQVVSLRLDYGIVKVLLSRYSSTEFCNFIIKMLYSDMY